MGILTYIAAQVATKNMSGPSVINYSKSSRITAEQENESLRMKTILLD